jgi:hypothetical protein
MIREPRIVPVTLALTPWSTTILKKIASILSHLLKTGGEKAGMLQILNILFVAYNPVVNILIVEA